MAMDIWKHGKYVDTWSLVHLLSGVLIASGLYGLQYPFWHALVVSAVMIVVWELFEWLTGIIEPGLNVLVDLVVGAVGFLLGSYYYYKITQVFDLNLFLALLGVTLSLSLWGFLDFIKRGYR